MSGSEVLGLSEAGGSSLSRSFVAGFAVIVHGGAGVGLVCNAIEEPVGIGTCRAIHMIIPKENGKDTLVRIVLLAGVSVEGVGAVGNAPGGC